MAIGLVITLSSMSVTDTSEDLRINKVAYEMSTTQSTEGLPIYSINVDEVGIGQIEHLVKANLKVSKVVSSSVCVGNWCCSDTMCCDLRCEWGYCCFPI